MRRGSASRISYSKSPGPFRISPAARNTAGGGRHQSADRVDLLRVGERGEIEADRFGHLVERRARLDDERAAARGVDRDFGLVVLVLDVADDRLDHVLDRDQTVGAAVFVDHQRHMRARHLHAQEKIERRHRGRGVEDRPQDAGVRERHVQPGRRARLRLRVRPGDQSETGDRMRERREDRECESCRADRRASPRRRAVANGRRYGTGPAPPAASRRSRSRQCRRAAPSRRRPGRRAAPARSSGSRAPGA